MQTNEKIIFLNKKECQKLIDEIQILRSSIKEIIEKIQHEQLKKQAHKQTLSYSTI